MLKSPILVTEDIITNPENDLYLIDAKDNNITITLPDITCDGMYFRICRIDLNSKNIVLVNSFNELQTINNSISINLDTETKVAVVSLNYIWFCI